MFESNVLPFPQWEYIKSLITSEQEVKDVSVVYNLTQQESGNCDWNVHLDLAVTIAIFSLVND